MLTLLAAGGCLHSNSGAPSDATGGGSGSAGGGTGSVGGGSGSASGAVDPTLPFLRDYAAREAPAFVSEGGAPPAAPGAAVSVAIDVARVERALPRTLWGNNVAVWHADSNLLSETAYQRLSTVNVSLLRFPGGSTADVYHWDGTYPAFVEGQAYNSDTWAVSTAEYMGLVRRLGALPVITANYGYATYDATKTDGNVDNAARLAADWVEYCNAPNDGSNPNGGTDWAAKRAADGSAEPFAVTYWEIGNEVFGSWETGYDSTGATYAANFIVIADAMKKVDPNIEIGLVVDPTSSHRTWTETVLSHPGTIDRADYLIVHTYFKEFTSPATATPEALLPCPPAA